MNIIRCKEITDKYFVKQGYNPHGSIVSDDLYPGRENKYSYRCDLRKEYVHRSIYIPFSTKKEIKEKAKQIINALNKKVENEINDVMKQFDTFNDPYQIGSAGYITNGFVDLRYENKTIYFRMHLISFDNYRIGSGRYYRYYNIKLEESEIKNLKEEMYKWFKDFITQKGC